MKTYKQVNEANQTPDSVIATVRHTWETFRGKDNVPAPTVGRDSVSKLDPGQLSFAGAQATLTGNLMEVRPNGYRLTLSFMVKLSGGSTAKTNYAWWIGEDGKILTAPKGQ